MAMGAQIMTAKANRLLGHADGLGSATTGGVGGGCIGLTGRSRSSSARTKSGSRQSNPTE
jgi:hypothetical protein